MISFAEMTNLTQVIKDWQVGDPVPEKLVAFHHHEGRFHCGVCATGHSVEDYIRDIDNDDFLKALLLDPRTDDRAFRATLWQVLSPRTLESSARFLNDVLAQNPNLIVRDRMREVIEQLGEPCIRLRIARFNKDRPLPLAHAWRVMREMQSQLNTGSDWKEAYRIASDQMQNQQDIEAGEKFVGTHLSYAFHGTATLDYHDVIDGKDLRTYEYASIPAGHLELLFEARVGTHIIETESALWLYFIEEYFPGGVGRSHVVQLDSTRNSATR